MSDKSLGMKSLSRADVELRSSLKLMLPAILGVIGGGLPPWLVDIVENST